jgi:hypothetical protein
MIDRRIALLPPAKDHVAMRIGDAVVQVQARPAVFAIRLSAVAQENGSFVVA